MPKVKKMVFSNNQIVYSAIENSVIVDKQPPIYEATYDVSEAEFEGLLIGTHDLVNDEVVKRES